MTEKEKMLAHQWYDANFDKDLETERVRAKIYVLTLTKRVRVMTVEDRLY